MLRGSPVCTRRWQIEASKEICAKVAHKIQWEAAALLSSTDNEVSSFIVIFMVLFSSLSKQFRTILPKCNTYHSRVMTSMKKILPLLSAIKGVTCASPDPLITDLLEWLRANGAYINGKVGIEHANKDDPSSPLGLIALADMDADEMICYIPPHLIIGPQGSNPFDSDDCKTIEATFEMLNAKETNAWARYLLAQTPRYTPEFWSDKGRAMLQEMTNDVLPPGFIDETIDELVELCHGDITNPLYLHAAMMVKSRADFNILTPFYGTLEYN